MAIRPSTNHSTRVAASLLACFLGSAAMADVPRVAVDIAPVHALVAGVMGDLGRPDLVLPQSASPHNHALRPSEARALQEADLVVWVGESLTPWLARPLETLSGEARTLELMAIDGVSLLETRQSAVFGTDHAHGAGEHAHGDEAHGEDLAHDGDSHQEVHAHDEESHGEEHAHEQDLHGEDHAHEAQAGDGEHAEGAAHVHVDGEGHDHDHGAFDPHLWLDPANARAAVAAVSAALSDLDPENADAYASNAEALTDRLSALEAELDAVIAPARGVPFVVFHDAYAYFEAAFGLDAAGAIAMSDARMPSAARLAELRDEMAAAGIDCVAAEPQFDPGLVEAVAEGAGVRVIELDPIGVTLDPGPGLYAAMMRGLADAFSRCAAKS